MKSLLVLAAVLLVAAPGLADAQVSVAQDSCFNMDGFVRVYFTVTNHSTDYGVLSFTMIPSPPSTSCNVVAAGATEPWLASLGGGGMVQFLAPPFPPYYFIGDRGGFYVDVTSSDCCYDVNYYDQTITLVYSDHVCFSSPCLDRPPILDEPVQWPVEEGGNGLYYQWVSAPGIDYWDASTAAFDRYHNGMPGNLVTIRSQAEQDWIMQTLAQGSFWTAGYSMCDGTWWWYGAAGAFTYTNWCGGEPNDDPCGALMMVTASGCWMDQPRLLGLVDGYIIKWDSSQVPVETKTWGGVKALYAD